MAKFVGEVRPGVIHVTVTVKEPRKANGELVWVDNTVEIPARKAKWDSLKTAAKQEAYAQECAEFHSAQGPGWQQKRAARRAIWDADDKAVADAAAAKAKAEQEAKDAAEAEAKAKAKYEQFTVRALAIEGDTVKVAITHHNATIQATLPADPAALEANARAAFAAWEQAEADKAAKLAAFAIG